MSQREPGGASQTLDRYESINEGGTTVFWDPACAPYDDSEGMSCPWEPMLVYKMRRALHSTGTGQKA